MKDLLFLDTETHSDRDPMLVQLAWLDVETGERFNKLYKPRFPIEFDAMAVHHITNEMVADKDSFLHSADWHRLDEMLQKKILVAHNAPFDIDVLIRQQIRVPRFIDTLRVAKHITQFDKHSLQYLRYAMGADRPEFSELSAHDALADVLVLEAVFGKLLEILKDVSASLFEEEWIEQMIELSKKPVLLKKMTFGKHAGRSFIDLSMNERDYLSWMVKNISNMDPDLEHTVKYYLSKR